MPRQSRPRVTVPALMHPAELPRPFHRHGWVYEEKYDGWRMVAERFASQVTLTSRNGVDHTQRFPELVNAIAELAAPSFILDGEVAIFDRQLISRFEWLRTRPKHEVSTPPMYMVFDLLELKGDDLRPRPLRERRQALEQLVAGHQLIIPARRLGAHGHSNLLFFEHVFPWFLWHLRPVPHFGRTLPRASESANGRRESPPTHMRTGANPGSVRSDPRGVPCSA